MNIPADKAAVFPFGHGLSYTLFSYTNLRITRPATPGGKRFVIKLEVTIAGDCAGDEVVQL